MIRSVSLTLLFTTLLTSATADVIVSIPNVNVAAGATGFLDVLISSDGTDDLQYFFADFTVGGAAHAAAPINFLESAIPAPQLSATAPDYVFIADSLEEDPLLGQIGVDFVTDTPGGIAANDLISVTDQTLSGLNATIDAADGQYLLARLNFSTPLLAPDGAIYSVELDDTTSLFQDDFGDDVNFSFTGGSITINSAAVPEPSSMGLLCLVGAGLFYCRRRKSAWLPEVSNPVVARWVSPPRSPTRCLPIMKSLLLYTVLASCFISPSAKADVITFQDRNAFRNATSGNVVIDFEGLLADDTVAAVAGQSLLLSGTTFVPANGTLFLAGTEFYQDTSVLTVQNGALPFGNVFSITLLQQIRAIGVDLSTPLAVLNADFNIQLSNGDASTTTSGRLPTFFGLISTTPFDSLTIRSAHPDTTSLEIDNFEFASTAAVPEPSSFILLTIAVGGVWLNNKRSKSVCSPKRVSGRSRLHLSSEFLFAPANIINSTQVVLSRSGPPETFRKTKTAQRSSNSFGTHGAFCPFDNKRISPKSIGPPSAVTVNLTAEVSVS